MVDNYPNSPFHRHTEAELLHNDGVYGGDSLADSANGTALDSDLESILREDSFLAFIDSEKMRQVAERLLEEKPVNGSGVCIGGSGVSGIGCRSVRCRKKYSSAADGHQQYGRI